MNRAECALRKRGIILIGAGGHSSACIDVIEQHGEFHIEGLVGQPQDLGADRLGYAVIGTDDDLPDLARRYQCALVTVGQIESPRVRIGIYRRVTELGFQMPDIVSPSAYVSTHASIGAGTIIMHGAIINAGASIGRNCIINSRALIEHDATVGDHCHISTSASLNGGVRIGDGSFVGSGSVVRDQISIGKECVVGLGLCVRHDQPDYTRFTGHERS